MEETSEGSTASTLETREALLFLAIAYQPVTLLELWLFVQLRLGFDAQAQIAASKLDETTRDAIRKLSISLGRWVLIRNPNVGEGEQLAHSPRYLVELRGPLLRAPILGGPGHSQDLGNQDLEERTSRESLAHADTAIICVKIATSHFENTVCSQYYSMQAHGPPLVYYSFQFWYSHVVKSNNTKNDELVPLIQKFHNELTRKSASLLGSLSLTMNQYVNDLRRSKGGIARSAGVVRLRSACLSAAQSLEELYGLSFESAFQAGRQLKPRVKSKESSKKQLAVDFWESMLTEYNRWTRRNYLSSIAQEILNTNLITVAGSSAYETYVNRSVTATQDLYALACELSVNPVRWDLLNPKRDFSPVIPFLMAGQALESIMLWPTVEYLKLGNESPWKAQQNNDQLQLLSYAVADIAHAPLDWETISQRSQEANKSYIMNKSNAFEVCWDIAVSHGLSHFWSLRSFLQRSGLQSQLQAVIDMLKGILSIPATLLLFLWTNIERFLSWFWLTFRWSCTLLLGSYKDLATGPWTMWRNHKSALLGGFGVYLLRNIIYPSFGQHWSPNAYHQIQTAITSPLAWVVQQNELTWTSYIWHNSEIVVLFSFASAHTSLQQSNFPLWGSCLRTLLGFYQWVYLERIICQIVNAALTVAVPIMLALQLEAAKPGYASGVYMYEALSKTFQGAGYSGLTAAIVRILFPIVLWMAASSYGFLADIVTFYTCLSMVPLGLIVTTWGLLVVLEEVKYYPPVFEDPANLLQLCLIIAIVLFLSYFLKEEVPRNPQRFLNPWRGFSRAVEISRKITGAEVVSLADFVGKERRTIQKQAIE